MSDIRFNQWLHNSGTGGISQDSAGHVGIGTTVPTHINALTNNNSILHVGIVSCNTLNAASKIEGSIDDWIIHQDDTNTKFGFPTTDTFSVETAGSETLRINSGGRVNIGHLNQTGSHLDYTRVNIYGHTSAGVGTNKNLNLLNVYNYGDGNVGNITGIGLGCGASPGGYTKASIGFIRTGTYGRGDLIFCINDQGNGNQVVEDNERLRIQKGGNVGIGTDDPDRMLHIKGTGNALVKMEGDYSGSVTGIEGVLTASGADRYVTGVYGKVVNTSGSESNVASIRLWNEQASPTTSDSPGYITFNTTNDGASTATEKVRITSAGDITTSGTTKIKPHTIGIGTTATTNTGVGTAYGEMMYNTTDDKLQIYTKSNKWYNVHTWIPSSEGYYASTTAASADGLNHYWPGNSSQSVISSLTPSGSPDGSPDAPVVNLTSDSYHGTYPYFNFYSGTSELGWMFLKSGTKWGNGPFTIAFWVRPQASTLESESTLVQLGSHAGLRSLYTVSTDASRKLKSITIGDDTGVHSSATLSTDWQHVVVTYETNNDTKYYINGSNVRTFAHSSNLDVGTSSQYIYIGYGYWNSTDSNKASMCQMSDIGIWDSDALTATEVLNLYKAKRIISGY